MRAPVETFSYVLIDQYDAIIDVRSPAEFAEDHIPGAINLPVLDNEERARVGYTYKQVSRFEARRMGAALVAKNIARHIETELSSQPADFTPLIYCWRGGMRSSAMALIFSQIGWPAQTLAGGYKTYRHHVQTSLYEGQSPYRIVLLDGNTGTAKTSLLKRLSDQVQVLDLEGLANHRGSIFGGLGSDTQPSQKLFESRLASALSAFDPDRPILVEAESNKIGLRVLPPVLWDAMQDAPRIEIKAPVTARADHLLQTYPELVENIERLETSLDHLTEFVGHEQTDNWKSLARSGDYHKLAVELMERHYDPAYDRSRQRHKPGHITTLTTRTLDESGLDRLCEEVVQALESLT